MRLEADGTVSGALTGRWEQGEGTDFACELDGVRYNGVMSVALDATEGIWVPCFSALDGSGAAAWGCKARE